MAATTACAQCVQLLRHVHSKNLEVAQLKDALVTARSGVNSGRSPSADRAALVAGEAEIGSLKDQLCEIRADRDVARKENHRLRQIIAKLESDLSAAVAVTRRQSISPHTAAGGGNDEEARTKQRETSPYQPDDTRASRPESRLVSAATTPRAFTPRPLRHAANKTASGSPATPSADDSFSGPERSKSAQRPGYRASSARRAIQALAAPFVNAARDAAQESPQRSFNVQNLAQQLANETSPTKFMGAALAERFSRRARQNPAFVEARVASTSAPRPAGRTSCSTPAAREQPRRDVAAALSWRSATLPIGSRRALAVAESGDLPPAVAVEARIGDRVASVSPRGDARLRELSQRSVCEGICAESAKHQLQELRLALVKADRSSFLAMNAVEFGRDPRAPFKTYFTSIKQIVAMHAGGASPSEPVVVEGDAWPVTHEQLSSIPAALGGALAKAMRQCMVAFDYVSDTAAHSSAQMDTMLTTREFLANVPALLFLARQPHVSQHL